MQISLKLLNILPFLYFRSLSLHPAILPYHRNNDISDLSSSQSDALKIAESKTLAHLLTRKEWNRPKSFNIYN